MKQRIVIRLHLAVRAVLQSEADWRGTRLGTLTSELIHEQDCESAPVRGAELRVEPRQQPLCSRLQTGQSISRHLAWSRSPSI